MVTEWGHMIVKDKTGRKLKIGQIVDVPVMGVFQGKIIAIKDSPIIISKDQQIHPHVAVAISMTSYIMPDGAVRDLYIIAEPDPNDPLVKAEESKPSGPKLVQ